MSIEFEEMTRIATAISNGAMGESITHCIEEDKFYIYKNGVWDAIYEVELGKMLIEHKEFNYIVKHSVSKRDQVLKNLKVLVQKRLEHFNKHGYLNFDIGEFDPETLKMYDHDKYNYSTMRITYPYDYNAKCPLWIITLDEIMEHDIDKINILQEFFGYCLTRDTTQRKALLLLGESNCGKSTILNVLRAMLGNKNCSSVPLKYISHPQYTPMLINKLANIDSDVSSKAEEFEAEFKIITSGEPVSCNQKFLETFEFTPYCKVIMAANIFPRITDHSSAFYNRLILIPCNRIFTEKGMNRNLFKQLGNELPGIFNWAVSGLTRLKERGMFPELDFMKEAVQDLENDNNPSNLFFEEHIEIKIGDNVYIEKGEIYEKYRIWCEKTRNYILSQAKFSQAVHKKFSKETPPKARIMGGKRIWRNLKYVESKETIEEKGEVVAWQD